SALASTLALMPAIVHIAPGEGGRVLDQFLQRPSRHYLSALLPSPRAKIDDVVSLADGLFIVFDHHNAIALLLQTVQCAQQLCIVAWVQTDSGFIEDITHTTQVRAQLRRQTETLRFPARQGIAATIQGQIAQA